MNLSKEKAGSLLLLSLGIFLIVQQVAMRYGRSYRSQNQKIDANSYDKLATYEISKLEEMWRKTDVDDLVTPQKLADQVELERAGAHLLAAEKEIQKSEERVQDVTGRKQEFFQKLHAYYHHSVSALMAIINFLIAKRSEYSVAGNEINFVSESDAEKFRELVGQLSHLDQEKQELDSFIVQHNRELAEKLRSIQKNK